MTTVSQEQIHAASKVPATRRVICRVVAGNLAEANIRVDGGRLVMIYGWTFTGYFLRCLTGNMGLDVTEIAEGITEVTEVNTPVAI